MIGYSLIWVFQILKIEEYQTGFTGSSGYKGLRPMVSRRKAEKIFIHPVNPVKNKKLKIESIQHSVPMWGKNIRANIFP